MEATFELTTREELIGMYSDTYKDAHGIRPRWINFSTMTDDEIEIGIEENCEIANENAKLEEIWANQKVVEFKELIQKTIDMGANDEETALLWLIQSDDSDTILDIQHFVWEYGILFTDYGKELVKKIENIIGE